MTERILIVDDDPDALTLIGLTLERRGYTVIKAASGPDALDLVDKERPDLVLLDLMMPQMDGYEVCRRLKSNPDLADIPIVMLTAKAQVTSQVEGYRVGADDYITKPVHPVDLASHIEAVLERTQERKLKTATGRVVGVIGVKGGVGTTTIATNLATSWADSRRTILADFDAGGGVTLHLGLSTESNSNLEELVSIDADTMTRESVARALISYNEDLKVLAAAEGTFSNKNASAVLTYMNSLADICVLDLGGRLNELTRTLLKKCALIVVAIDSDRAAVTQTQRTLLALNELGITRSRQWIVWVNRAGMDQEDALNAIRASIGDGPIHVINSATDEVYRSVESGTPLVISEPDSEAATALQEMARLLLTRVTGKEN